MIQNHPAHSFLMIPKIKAEPPGIEALCAIYITYAVIISVGILGNVILIKVFFKTKSMQMVSNIFITSLDFGDLLLLLTCVPEDATHYLAEGWLFRRIDCKVLSFIWVTSVGVSMFTLTILSADRTLYKSTLNMLTEEQKYARKQIEFRKRIVNIVLVLVALFALCWLPNHLLYLHCSFTYQTYVGPSIIHFVVTIVSWILAFSNSCINPFALYWLSKRFQQDFKVQLFCCKVGLLDSPADTPLNLAVMARVRAGSTQVSEISVTLFTGCSVKKDDRT